MSQRQRANIEDLFSQLLSWKENEKDLICWIFFLAVNLDHQDFFHRAKVLQCCDQRDFEALQGLFDNHKVRISYKDMQIFLFSTSFSSWLEKIRTLTADQMFIFFVTFLLSYNTDADGNIIVDELFKNYLSVNMEKKVLFLTLSAIFKRDFLKK